MTHDFTNLVKRCICAIELNNSSEVCRVGSVDEGEAVSEHLEWQRDGFTISTEPSRLQIERIHKFLSQESYWSASIPISVVRKAAANSLCFGVYDKSNAQVGFARVVTDRATFAWLCDVYVEESARGHGLSKWLMSCVMSHPDLQNLRRICLATKDAHSLYAKFGFEVTQAPANWMEIKDNEIYKKMSQT